MPRLHCSQAPMVGKLWGGIRGSGQENEGYDDVLDLDGRYSVYVCVRDTRRSHGLEARKEEKRRRNERMGTVTL